MAGLGPKVGMPCAFAYVCRQLIPILQIQPATLCFQISYTLSRPFLRDPKCCQVRTSATPASYSPVGPRESARRSPDGKASPSDSLKQRAVRSVCSRSVCLKLSPFCFSAGGSDVRRAKHRAGLCARLRPSCCAEKPAAGKERPTATPCHPLNKKVSWS